MNDAKDVILEGLNVFRALEAWGATLYAAWAERETDARLRCGHLYRHTYSEQKGRRASTDSLPTLDAGRVARRAETAYRRVARRRIVRTNSRL